MSPQLPQLPLELPNIGEYVPIYTLPAPSPLNSEWSSELSQLSPEIPLEVPNIGEYEPISPAASPLLPKQVIIKTMLKTNYLCWGVNHCCRGIYTGTPRVRLPSRGNFFSL